MYVSSTPQDDKTVLIKGQWCRFLESFFTLTVLHIPIFKNVLKFKEKSYVYWHTIEFDPTDIGWLVYHVYGMLSHVNSVTSWCESFWLIQPQRSSNEYDVVNVKYSINITAIFQISELQIIIWFTGGKGNNYVIIFLLICMEYWGTAS